MNDSFPLISDKDRNRLRALAAKQAEYAALPIMQQRTADWYAHHDNQQPGRPMIHLELWTFSQEIIPDQIQCENEAAKTVESALLQHFLNYELFDDDRVVPPFFPLQHGLSFKLFDAEIKRDHVKDSSGRNVGHRFQYLIKDLEEDVKKLKPSVWQFEIDKTMAKKAWLEDIFGDLLPVRLIGHCLGATLTQDVVHLMGMEDMLMAMYDCPDALHELMRRISEDYLAWFDDMAARQLILPNNTYSLIGQGTWGFTRKLPGLEIDALLADQLQSPVGIDQVWGFMDSQETVGISPQMFAEFFFPYYEKIGRKFGRLSYGCCEPVDAIWENCLSRFTNLSKVSVSPWCNENRIGEYLRGSQTIYHRKPSPNFLGVGHDFDEQGFTSHIRQTMQAARGCKLEITMRDIYTLSGNLPKARRAIEIIRHLSEIEWQA